MIKYFLITVTIFMFACNRTPDSPVKVSEKLLVLHDLLGKTPKERSKEAKNSEVDRDELENFFVDLDRFDKFTADIYVGIIVSALAQKQKELQEKISGKEALVRVGEGTIYFKLVQNRWKIDLEKTVPKKMKERAKIEKDRYESAKETGKALF
ncbi:MAG: hypothetical protein JXR91_13035 [Deltaproteobacteria bacterium]|nr:hypothetical protein [Deltaproteobacteria bacterium]